MNQDSTSHLAVWEPKSLLAQTQMCFHSPFADTPPPCKPSPFLFNRLRVLRSHGHFDAASVILCAPLFQLPVKRPVWLFFFFFSHKRQHLSNRYDAQSGGSLLNASNREFNCTNNVVHCVNVPCSHLYHPLHEEVSLLKLEKKKKSKSI